MADDYIQLPPDGAGKKLNTTSDTINAEVVHTQRMQVAGGGTSDINNTAEVDAFGALAVTFASGAPSLDAFGGLQVTNSFPAFQVKFVRDEATAQMTQSTTAGGTIARVAAHSMMTLTATTASGDIAEMASNAFIRYVPSVGTRTEMVVRTNDAGTANNYREWGFFGTDDGLFFRLKDTGLCFVVRTSTSGSPVDTEIPIASWDDPLDGSGRSGFTIDVTRLNIYWFDFQWLGAGVVRFGVFNDTGERIICGRVENASQGLTPYMRDPAQRLRVRNENFGVTAGTSSVFLSCASVRYDGRPRSPVMPWADMAVSGVSVSGATPLMSVRVKASATTALVLPRGMHVYTDQPIRIWIVQQPTSITSATWTGTSGGPMEYDDAGTAVSGGAIVAQRFVAAGAANFDFGDLFDEFLGRISLHPTGVQPTYTIMAQNVSAAATVEMAVDYEEL